MRVQPSSPKSELLGWNAAGELRCRLRARPVGGAANRELVRLLARALKVPGGEIRIETGGTARVKTLSAPAGARDPLLAVPEL